jgi:uncharacterized protein YpuA (DUF1002 family)
MGNLSEREYREKLNKTRERLNKKSKDIENQFAKMEKIKVELLKKTEEVRHDAEHEINKIQENVAKSKDLAPESKKRLQSEIVAMKSDVHEGYSHLKTRIAEAMVPA